MLTSTAYHPQTDDQSERTNQTVEIALRFHLTNSDALSEEWLSLLSYIQIILNNSTNFTIDFALNELCYEFRINNTLDLLQDLSAEDYFRLRQMKREEAESAIAFANALYKAQYDFSHISMKLHEGDMIYLRLHHDYKISGLKNKKLSNQRVDSFRIIQKVGNLVYRLELSSTMFIHPVISIAQLKPAMPGSDPYGRPWNHQLPSIEEENTEDPKYEVKQLLIRRITRGKPSYLMK